MVSEGVTSLKMISRSENHNSGANTTKNMPSAYTADPEDAEIDSSLYFNALLRTFDNSKRYSSRYLRRGTVEFAERGRSQNMRHRETKRRFGYYDQSFVFGVVPEVRGRSHADRCESASAYGFKPLAFVLYKSSRVDERFENHGEHRTFRENGERRRNAVRDGEIRRDDKEAVPSRHRFS